MSIGYEGDIIARDANKVLKKYKMIIASRESEVGCLKIIISEKDDEIKKLNEKLEEQKSSVRYYRDRLATAKQKLRKPNENSLPDDGV